MWVKFIQFICSSVVLYFTILIPICFAQETNDIRLLSQKITDVTVKNAVLKQTFLEKSGSCIVSFKISNSENQKEEEYECNLSDLNEYKIDLNTSKQSLKIVCETKGGKNVVRMYENGRIKKYTDKFDFYAKDVNNGKLIVQELQKQVKLCNENQNELSNIFGNSPDLNSVVEYLQTNVTKVTVNDVSIDQNFSVNEKFKALFNFEITNKDIITSST